MRLTFNSIRDGLDAINTASEQFASAQWQVSSGRRLRTSSDDPIAAQSAVNDQAEIATIDSYSRASDSAVSRLAMLDSVLGDVVDKITQALTAAQGARGSTLSASARATASGALTSIRDAIAGDINTTFNGNYLFSGSKAATKAYVQTAGVWTYQGDAVPVTLDVDRSRSVTLATSGQAILQGSDSTDVLSVLDSLAVAAASGDAAGLDAGMDALNRAFRRANEAQGHVGTEQQSVSDGQTRLATLRLASVAQLSKDRDANVVEAIAKMNQAQITYQAALGAVAAASKVSLLDYIK
jgi:flagellar hook-associated protein 3 FlgL